MANRREPPEEEKMEEVDLEGSEKEVTDSMVEDQLDNQSATGLSEAASRIRVESLGQRLERGTKILEISEDRVLVAMDRKS